MLTFENPIYLAREIAKLLESDVIATAQIKEHIGQDRLCELLGINPPEPEVSETFDISSAIELSDLPGICRRLGKAAVLEAING